jgi:N-hydroxyarylamine O-acetyltransferase
MNQAQYLKRIKYEGSSLKPSLENLYLLQRLHLISVPFENLDIHFGKKILLENTFNKVINQQRGGFCYELNGLFCELLKDIGFNVDIISARVYNKKKNEYPPEFDHMALVVHFGEEKYLADVGNGEFATYPLRVDLNVSQSDPKGQFIIEKYPSDPTYFQVSKITDNTKKPEYIFTLKPREVSEFLPMLHYQQTNPESHFQQKKICTRSTENGRITISDNTIKFMDGDIVKEEYLESEEAFLKSLRDYFNIALH